MQKAARDPRVSDLSIIFPLDSLFLPPVQASRPPLFSTIFFFCVWFFPSISPAAHLNTSHVFLVNNTKWNKNVNPLALLYSLGSVRLLLRLPVLGGGERDCRETLSSSSCEQPAWMARR